MNHTIERACTAHQHNEPREAETTVEPNGLTYIVLRCTTCDRPQGLRLVRGSRGAHYRMVDSRLLNDPLTAIAETLDVMTANVVWSDDDDDRKADLLASIMVIRNAQQAICKVAFTTQPPV